MSLKISPILLQFNPKLTPILQFNSKPLSKISCSKEKEIITDEILALKLSIQVTKLKTQTIKTQQALQKGSQLLFLEISSFMGLNSEDVKKKWNRMSEDEKLLFVKAFVAQWSAQFHPLSVNSVKQMVEDYLSQQEQDAQFQQGFLVLPIARNNPLSAVSKRMIEFAIENRKRKSLRPYQVSRI